jgi:N-acetylneuraminic acid mutarotase
MSIDRRTFLHGGTALGLLAVTPAWASDRWRRGPDLPVAVQEVYAAVHDGSIHVAGGFTATDGRISGVSGRHFSLSPGAAAWQEETPLPLPHHHPQLVSDGARLFLLGGFVTRDGTLDWTMTPATHVLDGERWVPGADAPSPHAESVAAHLDGWIHVVGGRTPSGTENRQWRDHADTGQHLVYVVEDDRWGTAAPLPEPRNSAAGGVLQGRLHVVGGRTVDGGNSTAHHAYDPATDRWARLAPLPQGQGGLCAAVADGRLHAMGGEFFEDGGGVYAEHWVYEPSADRWAAAAPMPTPRHGLAAAAIDGEVFTIGGAVRAGGNGTSARVEIFTGSRR